MNEYKTFHIVVFDANGNILNIGQRSYHPSFSDGYCRADLMELFGMSYLDRATRIEFGSGEYE